MQSLAFPDLEGDAIQDASKKRRLGLHHLRKIYAHNLRMGLRSAISGLNFHSCRESLLICEEVFGRSRGEALRILDIASWRSVLPAYLAEQGHDSVTVDLAEGHSIQEKLRRHLKHPHRMTNVEVPLREPGEIRYPFEDASIDLITVINALTVFPGSGDISVMREVHRMLKPGGRVIFTVPRGEYTEQEFGRWFSRCYDDAAIEDRLVNSTPLELESIQLFGSAKEDRFVDLYWKLPSVLRFALGNLWYWVFLSYLPHEESAVERHNHSGAGLILRKMR